MQKGNAEEITKDQLIEALKEEARRMTFPEQCTRLEDLIVKRNAARVMCMPFEEEIYSRVSTWLTFVVTLEQDERTTERPDILQPPTNYIL